MAQVADVRILQAWAVMEAKLQNLAAARAVFRAGVAAAPQNPAPWNSWIRMEEDANLLETADQLRRWRDEALALAPLPASFSTLPENSKGKVMDTVRSALQRHGHVWQGCAGLREAIALRLWWPRHTRACKPASVPMTAGLPLPWHDAVFILVRAVVAACGSRYCSGMQHTVHCFLRAHAGSAHTQVMEWVQRSRGAVGRLSASNPASDVSAAPLALAMDDSALNDVPRGGTLRPPPLTEAALQGTRDGADPSQALQGTALEAAQRAAEEDAAAERARQEVAKAARQRRPGGQRRPYGGSEDVARPYVVRSPEEDEKRAAEEAERNRLRRRRAGKQVQEQRQRKLARQRDFVAEAQVDGGARELFEIPRDGSAGARAGAPQADGAAQRTLRPAARTGDGAAPARPPSGDARRESAGNGVAQHDLSDGSRRGSNGASGTDAGVPVEEVSVTDDTWDVPRIPRLSTAREEALNAMVGGSSDDSIGRRDAWQRGS
jgi:hypothetical protein